MKVLFLPALIILIVGCEFSKSVSRDLVTGITSSGDGLSAGNVYLSTGNDRLSRKTFTYGEQIYFRFDDVQGFQKTDGKANASMSMTITGVAGDTVLQFNDLFADAYEGLDQNPLTLTANLVMAQPLHSGEKYRWIIKISDKTGTGRFESSLDFDLVPNSNLSIRAEGINCREIYLYSAAQAKIITDNIVTAGEDIYLVFEGLQGVTPESGRMPAGLSMTATDSAGTIILNETDLIGENGMDPEQFAKQVAPSFNFSGTDIKNPVACEVKIWDKTSSKHISANFTLDLKQ